MRFWTIWTLPACTLRERLRRTRDWFAQFIASKLPLRVRYWVAIQELSRATVNSKNIPATPLDEVLRGLQHPASMS